MVKQASVLSQLESIVGAEGVRDAAAFTIDGLTPQAAVAPAGYEQAAEVMRFAHAQEMAVIPRGGGAHMHVGNVPRRYDIALSLSRLDQVVEYEPADLTVSCQAGIPLEALRDRLAGQGQFVPLEAPGVPSATVGGVLAANVSGPARHAYGAPRDFTIGMRVVTADGRVTRAGGRVVKNVAGYDLCKLYIGSLGTLGIIVEATFKLAPLPRAERTLVATFADAVGACRLATELRRRGLAVRSLELLNVAAASAAGLDGPFALVIGLAGTPQAVERSRQEVEELAVEASDLTNAEPAIAAAIDSDAMLTCKATALPTRLPALVEAIESGGEPRIAAWPTTGVVRASWTAPQDVERTIDGLRRAAAEAGGSLVVERCPIDLKRRIDVFGEPPPSFELMRRVKRQFDPKDVLSPGRQVGKP